MKFAIAVILAICLGAGNVVLSKDIKLGILSDIHLNLRYDATTAANFCTWSDDDDKNATSSG